MKVGNTDWTFVSQTRDAQCAFKRLKKIEMGVIESFGIYKLSIGHSYKYVGNTYYNLRSKDIESACNEADDIARGEFTEMVKWYKDLIDQLPDI